MLLSKTAAALLTGAFTLPALTVVLGTAGDDTLVGTPGRDLLLGLAGNDHMSGGDGDDLYFGGPGIDFMPDLEGGDDRMYGGPGDDGFRPGPGNDWMFGEGGDDSFDFYRRVDLFATPPYTIESGDYDIAFCGGGDDQVNWASGLAYLSPLLPPSLVHCGSGAAFGGGGWDVCNVGFGSFLAPSTSYTIVTGVVPGYHRLVSLESGAMLHLVGFEEIVFSDMTVTL